MVKGNPATVSVPTRADVVGLAPTVYCTAPGPVPFAPPVMVIHEALVPAFHAQPGGPLTLTVPPPPVSSTDWPAGDKVKVHGPPGAGFPGAAASCEMMTA
jgi:hypothetical protein